MNTINVEILAEMYRVFFFQVFHHIPSRPARTSSPARVQKVSHPIFNVPIPEKKVFQNCYFNGLYKLYVPLTNVCLESL